MDLGQGDDRYPGIDRVLTDVAMVPPILMAGIKSTGYKTKKSQPMWREYYESNHGKGSVLGQLVQVEYNRMTVSDTVSIDEPAN